MTQTLADVTERRCQHFGGHIPLPDWRAATSMTTPLVLDCLEQAGGSLIWRPESAGAGDSKPSSHLATPRAV